MEKVFLERLGSFIQMPVSYLFDTLYGNNYADIMGLL